LLATQKIPDGVSNNEPALKQLSDDTYCNHGVTSLRKTIMEDNVKQNDVKMGWLAI
jgi:hypothetical protein